MTLKEKIRNWLGYNEIDHKLDRLYQDNKALQSLIYERETQISSLLNGVGRLIAKIDPLFAIPEDDPRRKALSDELGNSVIKKLKAESKMWSR